jgi:branched-chain amino acid transport system ATP-binding protein
VTDRLEMDGVHTTLGVNRILNGIDLRVPVGTTTGIFGLNGAGKSVTMKVLAGLLPATSGSVRLDGEDITSASPEERVGRGMAYVPQGRQLFPSLTVEQNLRLGGYLVRRHDKAHFATVLQGIYARFPRLEERRTQLAGSLSGGERAMLAVGRALMNEPKVLLIDEPTAGLAPHVITDVLSLLLELRADGLTMVLVEQNLPFGFRLAERAAILQRGKVVYEGDVATLDTERVAHLLGVGRLLGGSFRGAVDRGTPSPTRPPRQPRRARRVTTPEA